MFGIISSPFLLGARILVHMKKYEQIYPEIIEKFLRDLFVEDNVSGAQSKSDAYDLYLIKEVND